MKVTNLLKTRFCPVARSTKVLPAEVVSSA